MLFFGNLDLFAELIFGLGGDNEPHRLLNAFDQIVNAYDHIVNLRRSRHCVLKTIVDEERLHVIKQVARNCLVSGITLLSLIVVKDCIPLTNKYDPFLSVLQGVKV